MTDSRIAGGLTALVALTFAAPAIAQEQDELPSVIEEIVVISTKRESTLQEVPVAVSVVSNEVLQEAQVLDIKDLQFVVPSLRVSQLQTSSNATFLIRGFGNGANNAGVEPSVGVFIDGVYRSRSASMLADFPNLERIEVIKGPQSTLFGKNASAGVINVVTEKPDLNDFGGSISVGAGEFSQVLFKGDITGPISDTVAFSLSGSYNQRDGYFDNLETGNEFNEVNRYGVRGQLLFQPNDRLEARLIADYDKIDEVCCGVANLRDGIGGFGVRSPGVGGSFVADDPFAYENNYNYDAINEVENSGVSLQFDYDFTNAMTFTSITAFRNLERFDNADSDFTSGDLISQTAGNLTDTTLDTFTQEFRLSGGNERFDWLVGAFWFDEDVEQNSGVLFGGGARPYVDTMTKLLAIPDDTPPEDLPALLAAAADPSVPSPLLGLEAGLATVCAAFPLPLASCENGPFIPGGTFFQEGQGTLESGALTNEALSLFAQFDFNVNDFTTLTLGINYTEDEKDVSLSTVNTNTFSQLDLVQVGNDLVFAELVGQGVDPATAAGIAAAASTTPCSAVPPGSPCNPTLPLQVVQVLPPLVDYPNVVEDGRSKDDATTWTARLAFDVSDAVNLYLSAGTGFKATSWNLSRDSRPFPADIPALVDAGLAVPNLTPATRFAGPEDSTLFEAGMKAQFDTVAVNLAIFDQEIEDFQENVFQGTGFVLTNAGKQSTTGFEVDMLWSPTRNLDFTLAGMFLDPVYDSYENAPGVGGPVDLSGQNVPGVSETTISTSGRWSFDVGNSIRGFVRADYYYESDVQVISNVPENVAERGVSTVNASIGFAWDNGLEVLLWGRNLNNDEYLQSAFPTTFQSFTALPPDTYSYSGYPNQPRTWGATVSYYFD